MRKSREATEETRRRIVTTAGRLLQERGLDGVGVAELMAAAGLTHGAFYAHFPSREALLAEACAASLSRSTAGWTRVARDAPAGGGLAAILDAYLSSRHRDAPSTGCAVPALAGDVPRHPDAQRAYTEGVHALLAVLEGLVGGRGAAVRRQRALALMAAMVGAVTLSRAIDDPALSDAILDAVHQQGIADGSPSARNTKRRRPSRGA